MAIALANDDVTNSIPRRVTGNDLTAYVCDLGGPTNVGTYTPGANSLLVAVFTAAGGESPSTVTGHGLSYTSVVNASTTNAGRLSIWAAVSGASPTSAACTVNYAVAATGVVLYDLEFTGVDVTGGAAAAFVQTPTATNSAGVTTIDTTLAAASNANNRPLAACLIAANEAVTVDASYTAIHDQGHGSPNRRLTVSWQPGGFDTTVTHTWTSSVAVRAYALELLASGGGGPGVTAADPFGMSGFFGG